MKVTRRQFTSQLTAGCVVGSASNRSMAGPVETPQIWDLHCHLSGVDGNSALKRAAELLALADRMHIDRLIFFMGFPFSQNPSSDEMRRQNDQVLGVVERWSPRIMGFVYLNANFVEASLRELDRCVDNGPMVGIKLWVARRCADEQLDIIVRRAAALNAVIYQHTWWKATGNLGGESTPDDLAQLAARHPTVPMICGHSGGDWERGIRAVRRLPNISIGLGGFDPTAGVVEMGVRDLGADRIIYGSDIGGRSFASQLAKVVGADVPTPAKHRILSGNLRRLLSPILKAKGLTT